MESRGNADRGKACSKLVMDGTVPVEDLQNVVFAGMSLRTYLRRIDPQHPQAAGWLKADAAVSGTWP